jgi:hypothetical protein
MSNPKHCFNCSVTKQTECFTQASPNKPAICDLCSSKIRAKRRAEKRKTSGEAMTERQAQQKIERDAKPKAYYKDDQPKLAASNVRLHKKDLDAYNERIEQRKIDEEIGL